jgi:hypothetical protein
VSAVVTAWPWPSRTPERAAATVDATAIPIAPPSCWDESIRPEATPASRSVTPTRAPIDTGMNAQVTAPVRKKGPARVTQKLPCAGTWAAQRIPAPVRVIPAAITSLTDARVTSICAGPASATPVRPTASQARPVVIAE